MNADALSPSLSRGKWMTLLAAFLGWMFDGFEMGLFPLVGRPALTELLGESGKSHVDVWFGVMIAGFLVGAATGGVLFGWLGDRLGRVRAMTLSVFTYAIFMGLCGVANSPRDVFLFRFISSLGMGGEWSLGVALVMEIWPDRSRALLAGLIGAAANVGFLSTALVGLILSQFVDQAGHSRLGAAIEPALLSLGIPSAWASRLVAHSAWRLMMLIGAMPALLTFFVQLLVPESQRWEHERRQGATSHWATRDLVAVLFGSLGPLAMIYLWVPETDFPLSVRIVGSIGGLGIAIVGFVYPVFRYLQRAEAATIAAKGVRIASTGPTLRRMLLGACLSGVALVGTWASVQLAPSWTGKLIEVRGERNGQAADSPQIRAEADVARSWTQIVSGIGAIVGTLAGALIANHLGRRPTYFVSCAGSLGASLLFYLGNRTFGPSYLLSMTLVGGLTASFYGWLPLYLPEIFPTRVRATAQGFSFNFGRIIAAVGALQTGNLMALFGHDKVAAHANACATISLVYVVGMVLIWFVPETRGQPLPE